MPAQNNSNAWMNMLNIQGDQTNPAIMSQMAQQAAPIGGMSSMPPPPPPGAQAPEIVPPPPQKSPITAQLTTAPLGATPQEIVPQPQKNLNAPVSQRELYDRIEAMKPIDDSAMRNQLAFSEKGYKQSEAMHQEEIDKLKTGLANYASSERGIDFTPLAALSDSIYGSKLTGAAQAMAPETAAKKMQNMQEMQTKIAAAQGEMPKEQMEMIKAKLAQMGYMSEREQKLELAKITAEAKLGGYNFQNARLDMMGKRLDYQIGKEARTTMNNDPILKLYTPRLEGAAKIGELIQAANEGKVVANNVFLHQLNQEITRLETGASAVAEGTVEKTSLNDAKSKLQSLYDSVTGDPQSAVDPRVIDTARKMVEELNGSYMKGIDARMSFLSEGMTPEQKVIAKQKHDSIRKLYAPRVGGWHGLNEVTPQAGEVLDGHVFLGGDPADPTSWQEQ